MEKVTLWGCKDRFGDTIDDTLAKLNNSLPVDKRLYKEDIVGSLAYAEILCENSLLTKNELSEIQKAFKTILDEWNSSQLKFVDSDEDVHTVNERRLTELIGDIGRKIHTGRSRNEQTVVDVKLWMKNAVQSLLGKVSFLIKAITKSASQNIQVLMPGYTHLQRAQPVKFSHWLLSYGFFLKQDAERLNEFLFRLDSCPLGSGAIAGNPFDIDRERLGKLLGFQRCTPNSMYAVGDRDYIVEFNFIGTLISTHLGRLSEDLILYSSKEFNFIKLSGKYCTGSSLMPQKFNPDSLELVRGSTGPICGELLNILMTLKGLPSTYNKDLQNDKKSIFNVFDTLSSSLDVMSGVIESFKVHEDVCRNALSFNMLATDLAYYLVKKGIPFREAHHKSTEVVNYAEINKIQIDKIPLKELQKICSLFDEDISEVWNFEKSVEQYSVYGGTSESSVKKQIDELNTFVAKYGKN